MALAYCFWERERTEWESFDRDSLSPSRGENKGSQYRTACGGAQANSNAHIVWCVWSSWRKDAESRTSKSRSKSTVYPPPDGDDDGDDDGDVEDSDSDLDSDLDLDLDSNET